MTEITQCDHPIECVRVHNIITNDWVNYLDDGGQEYSHTLRTKVVCLECGATGTPVGAIY